MDQHKWLLHTLQIVAGEARNQPTNRALQKLRDVIETYANEVSSGEAEEIEVLEHMVFQVGPLFRSKVGRPTSHCGETHIVL